MGVFASQQKFSTTCKTGYKLYRFCISENFLVYAKRGYNDHLELSTDAAKIFWRINAFRKCISSVYVCDLTKKQARNGQSRRLLYGSKHGVDFVV